MQITGRNRPTVGVQWPSLRFSPAFLVAGLVLASLVLVACSAPASTPAPAAAITDPVDVPRISVEDAKAQFDANSAVFVDTRAANWYADLHVTDARNIPLGEVAQRAGELSKDQLIITYCT